MHPAPLHATETRYGEGHEPRWTRARRRFAREVAAEGLSHPPGPRSVVREEEIAALPEPVRRYLRFMRVIGRPRDWSFRVASYGRFRLRPDQAWMPCEAWQYDSALDVARIFHLKVALGGVVPMIGRDTYVGRRGRMLVKLLDLVPVVDATGPELDASELVTYLDDALLLAPSMILAPSASWSAIDDATFEVALTDRGRTVRARVTLDERGAPREVSTEDRWGNDPFTAGHPMTRAHWTTPVDAWAEVDGHPFAAHGRGVWHFGGGVFEYADLHFDPASLAFNVPPGA